MYCIVSILLLLHIEGWAQREAIILKNVNIVDVVEGSIHKGQDVVMKGGIIQAIGKDVGTGIAGEVKDLAGMYVMPGLIDAHVHIANDPKETQDDRAKHLKYFLRHGITSIRDAAGDARVLRELKEGVQRRKYEGPDIYIMPLLWRDLLILRGMTGRKVWWKVGRNLMLLGCNVSVRILIWIKS